MPAVSMAKARLACLMLMEATALLCSCCRCSMAPVSVACSCRKPASVPTSRQLSEWLLLAGAAAARSSVQHIGSRLAAHAAGSFDTIKAESITYSRHRPHAEQSCGHTC